MRRFMDPFEELRRMQERIGRLFEEFEPRYAAYTIPVDVIDEDDRIRVVAELPGFDKKDIEVYVEDSDLVIRAERKEEEEEVRKNYIRKERRYGETYRRIAIPMEVEVDKITAKYNNGILEVILPKSEKERKVIKID
ncbi:heat shock protein Hsp20 [Archaeoglobus sulfaticallidus PM70-1]|uniref:Heat shock protein Hsp20 n=1 Tax=Archaeoglobus sulfaticallidus PM70-1 TaxID=387631 RepID=N0BFQ0_9EURY|nr:Hsp20/alpha crystallin family protein [Archaeoglobus sulfaticallidus]AGK61097.1 heat shock protein Hsp20 [Archaeoglobus sulfaticallidus PM70-1]